MPKRERPFEKPLACGHCSELRSPAEGVSGREGAGLNGRQLSPRVSLPEEGGSHSLLEFSAR